MNLRPSRTARTPRPSLVAALLGRRGARVVACADVRAGKIREITTTTAGHAEVRYEREVQLRPSLTAIDEACGATTRPPGETKVALEKSTSGWTLAGTAPAPLIAH